MLEEEAQVIAGLLVGLNVIDCNMGIKDEDLDKPVMLFVILFFLYYLTCIHKFILQTLIIAIIVLLLLVNVRVKAATHRQTLSVNIVR